MIYKKKKNQLTTYDNTVNICQHMADIHLAQAAGIKKNRCYVSKQ